MKFIATYSIDNISKEMASNSFINLKNAMVNLSKIILGFGNDWIITNENGQIEEIGHK
jgi:hypothetical protein